MNTLSIPLLAAAIALVALVPAQAQEAVKKCLACHTFDKGGAKKIGPNLFGVYGQPTTLPELAGKAIVWDDANLMAYLENPSAFLAAKTGGTAKSKMALLVKDAAERKAAIDHLKTLK